MAAGLEAAASPGGRIRRAVVENPAGARDEHGGAVHEIVGQIDVHFDRIADIHLLPEVDAARVPRRENDAAGRDRVIERRRAFPDGGDRSGDPFLASHGVVHVLHDDFHAGRCRSCRRAPVAGVADQAVGLPDGVEQVGRRRAGIRKGDRDARRAEILNDLGESGIGQDEILLGSGGKLNDVVAAGKAAHDTNS